MNDVVINIATVEDNNDCYCDPRASIDRGKRIASRIQLMTGGAASRSCSYCALVYYQSFDTQKAETVH